MLTLHLSAHERSMRELILAEVYYNNELKKTHYYTHLKIKSFAVGERVLQSSYPGRDPLNSVSCLFVFVVFFSFIYFLSSHVLLWCL